MTGNADADFFQMQIAMQAMTLEQLKELDHRMARLAVPFYGPSIGELLVMQNYRPPVHVPEGWRDWFAIGDQLQ